MYIIKYFNVNGEICYDGPMSLAEAKKKNPYDIAEVLGTVGKNRQNNKNIVKLDGDYFWVRWL